MSNRKTRANPGQFIAPAHKRLSRALGYCLTLGTEDAWAGFSFVAAVRLSEIERAALAFAALNSLEPEHAEIAAASAIGAADMPLPAFLGGMADARHWAELASRSERKAYALAAFEAMTPRDRAAFARHINSQEIAA